MDKFKKILSVITLVLVGVIAYGAFTSETVIDGQSMTMIQATWEAFKSMNIWVLLVLIPEQVLMY